MLDTNIWLDWLVFGEPSLAALKAAVAERRAELFIDAACEAELARVLAYDLGSTASMPPRRPPASPSAAASRARWGRTPILSVGV